LKTKKCQSGRKPFNFFSHDNRVRDLELKQIGFFCCYAAARQQIGCARANETQYRAQKIQINLIGIHCRPDTHLGKFFVTWAIFYFTGHVKNGAMIN
jgi:hypothetical protein